LLIGVFVEQHRLGQLLASPVDVRLSRYDVVEPDLVFIPAERRLLLSGNFIDGLPAIVIEVLSPSTKGIDLVRKRALYATAGIPEYWIVDPEAKSLIIHRLVDGMYEEVPSEGANPNSVVLTGLEIDLAKLFKDAV
jgi:Uma2 family endonuclease